jgi:hypothetical protein
MSEWVRWLSIGTEPPLPRSSQPCWPTEAYVHESRSGRPSTGCDHRFIPSRTGPDPIPPPKSRLLRFVEQAYLLAQRAVARCSSKLSKRRYTLHQHIVLLCLKVRKNTTYEMLLGELIEMSRIRRAIDLEELPSPSTLC